ncbi:MAG: sulfotransferase family 2 domain-containing protein [Pseudomonadales bacterium]|nr:sulfotransferase family 2 domain-containing protein [Pseudomonadales bacterium]
MFISNSQRFIFVHIMKTGGTSVSSCLADTLAWNDISLGGTQKDTHNNAFYRKQFGLAKHSRAEAIASVIGQQTWNDYFSFAFVRHPYSRAISLYRFAARLANSNADKPDAPANKMPIVQAFNNTATFSGFIGQLNAENALGIQLQKHWVTDKNGNTIVNFVGRYENIGDDYRYIAERLHLPQQQLPQKNPSGKTAVPTLTHTDYDLLFELFREDIAFFDYDAEWRL